MGAAGAAAGAVGGALKNWSDQQMAIAQSGKPTPIQPSSQAVNPSFFNTMQPTSQPVANPSAQPAQSNRMSQSQMDDMYDQAINSKPSLWNRIKQGGFGGLTGSAGASGLNNPFFGGQ